MCRNEANLFGYVSDWCIGYSASITFGSIGRILAMVSCVRVYHCTCLPLSHSPPVNDQRDTLLTAVTKSMLNKKMTIIIIIVHSLCVCVCVCVM